MNGRRGITLTELLVTTACLGLLLGALVPSTLSTRDAAHRTVCAANLSSLGRALHCYAADYDGLLPDTGAASPLGGAVPTDGYHFPSHIDAPGSCAWPRVRSVGNQANLWLLVQGDYADAKQFICPATSDRPSLNSQSCRAVMGFLAMNPATNVPVPAEKRFLSRVTAGRCSYSYQVQLAHPDTTLSDADLGASTTALALHPGRLAVLADRNPYTRTEIVRQPVISPQDDPEANSLNHGGSGQNVLYLSGEVEWHDTPRCGMVRGDGLPDPIYWPDAGLPTDPLNVPRSLADSFLAP